MENVDRPHILRVLEQSNWKIEGPVGAAVILALKPSTLRSRMRKLGRSIIRPKVSLGSPLWCISSTCAYPRTSQALVLRQRAADVN